jgi:protein involved in sex pheromone biosynthesis
MKRHIALGLVASTLFLAGCCTSPHATAKWEYQKTSDFSEVQKLGAEGWSLVCSSSETSGNYYILKRLKQ